MNIKFEQLRNHLRNGLLPLYVISGDEPLQHSEATDLIRVHAREQDFSERDVFHVESGFDWGALYEAGNTLSLFATRRIIELRMSSLKPGDKGTKALVDFCQNPSPDNVLIISLPKLDATAKKSKWFRQLESIGGVVQVWPIESNQLNGWIAHRMKQNGLNPTAEAVGFLAEKVEGNLLAAAQEIEKLALLYQGDVSLDVIAESVADSAKFDVFSLVDAALKGKPERINRVLNILRASGVEPVLVQWALTQEIRKLQTMASSYRPGPASEQLFRKYGVWSSRIPVVRKALERVRPKHWTKLLCHAARIDRINKGMASGNSWDELLKLGVAMGGNELMRDPL